MSTASSLSSMNGSPILFTQDQKNILVCSSNFQSQQNQTTPVMGEITADQILDMPIVFADEPPSQEELKHTTDNSSYFITNPSNQQIIVKEELIDEEENLEVVCPTRTAIPERLKIKQVYFKIQFIIF